MNYYPVFLNIKDKGCVVCGGGEVARRKVKILLEHEARITVISPALDEELADLAKTGVIQVLHRGYQEGDLENAFMAIAATDDQDTNLKIAGEARRKRCLINTVDDADNSDFIVPSLLRRGDITIAISTSGRSPALARKLRTRLEEEIGNEYSSLVSLIGEARAEIRESGVKVDGDTWQEALNLDVLLALLRSGKAEEARTTIIKNQPI